MAAILEQHPPPVSTLQSLSPKRFDDVVRICLAKHPDERWQSAADIVHELRLIGQDKTVATPSPKRIGKRERIVWAGALSAAIVASVVLFWITSQREVPAKVSFDVTANSIGAMDRLRVRRERNISGVRARLPGSPREVASLQPEIGVSALESQRQRALLRRIGMVGGGRCDHVGESIPGRNTPGVVQCAASPWCAQLRRLTRRTTIHGHHRGPRNQKRAGDRGAQLAVWNRSIKGRV